MGLSVLWKSFLFGPMLSALTLQFMAFSNDSFFQQSIGDFIDMFLFLCVGAYVLMFFPVSGGPPGVFPLAIYSGILAFLIDPLIDKMNAHDIKPLAKVLFITFLSVFVGVLVYCPFFLLFAHSDQIVKLLLSMVIPTSTIFGAWFGLSGLRKYS